jgi:tetraacyldisaccharide 4'-kinase
VLRDVEHLAPGVPVLTIALLPDRWVGATGETHAPGGEALAVAGVAAPELFVANAREAGANITGVITFRDHYTYAPADAERIRMVAAGRAIVTTEKDWIKLAPLLPGADVRVLRQKVEVGRGGDVLDRLLGALGT